MKIRKTVSESICTINPALTNWKQNDATPAPAGDTSGQKTALGNLMCESYKSFPQMCNTYLN